MIVKSFLTVEELLTLIKYLNTKAKVYEPDSYLIEKGEKAGKRSMAEGREGYVRMVGKVASQHNDKLNKKDDAAELENRLEYDANLEKARQALMAMSERIADTQFSNSVDCMTLADRYVVALNSARRESSDLDEAMAEIDGWNARFGPSGINPDEVKTISKD